MPAVKPWQWGLCEQWMPQDWLGFVLTTIDVENDPDVKKVMAKRAEQESKQSQSPNAMSFNINRGRPVEE